MQEKRRNSGVNRVLVLARNSQFLQIFLDTKTVLGQTPRRASICLPPKNVPTFLFLSARRTKSARSTGVRTYGKRVFELT